MSVCHLSTRLCTNADKLLALTLSFYSEDNLPVTERGESTSIIQTAGGKYVRKKAKYNPESGQTMRGGQPRIGGA